MMSEVRKNIDPRELIGKLWERDNPKVFATGQIAGYDIVIFPNGYKKPDDKQPELRILLGRKMTQKSHKVGALWENIHELDGSMYYRGPFNSGRIFVSQNKDKKSDKAPDWYVFMDNAPGKYIDARDYELPAEVQAELILEQRDAEAAEGGKPQDDDFPDKPSPRYADDDMPF